MKEELVDLMELFGDLCTLTQIFRAFHWNVKSESGLSLHEIYGEIYECLDSGIDKTAEYIKNYDPAQFITFSTEETHEVVNELTGAGGDYLDFGIKIFEDLIDHLNDIETDDRALEDILTTLCSECTTFNYKLKTFLKEVEDAEYSENS